MLFTSIYKSWCHNAVAAFALCLLSQAYEHASNLLQILCVDTVDRNQTNEADCPALHSAELEMTVALLVQIDKLVMLIESPVFTCKRIDRTPYGPSLTDHLPACSSAIATPRARETPLPLQVSIRPAYASPAKQRFRIPA